MRTLSLGSWGLGCGVGHCWWVYQQLLWNLLWKSSTQSLLWCPQTDILCDYVRPVCSLLPKCHTFHTEGFPKLHMSVVGFVLFWFFCHCCFIHGTEAHHNRCHSCWESCDVHDTSRDKADVSFCNAGEMSPPFTIVGGRNGTQRSGRACNSSKIIRHFHLQLEMRHTWFSSTLPASDPINTISPSRWTSLANQAYHPPKCGKQTERNRSSLAKTNYFPWMNTIYEGTDPVFIPLLSRCFSVQFSRTA